MSEISCGLAAYIVNGNEIEIFLVQPGGPFYKSKEYYVWSLPKGHHEGNGTYLDTAKREFEEETGIKVHLRQADPLPDAITSHKKTIKAWAFESPERFKWRSSNLCTMEYKGKKVTFPEVKRGEWFTLSEAMKRITPSQQIFIQALAEKQAELIKIQQRKKEMEEAAFKQNMIREERRKKFLKGIGKTNSDVLIESDK